MSVRAKVPRPKSKWKNRVFRELSDRDGAKCSQCGAKHRLFWQSAGEQTSLDWGGEWPRDPMWLGCYTAVNLRSLLEVDHRKRLADGGTNDLSNLWLLCRDCHLAKTIAEQSLDREAA